MSDEDLDLTGAIFGDDVDIDDIPDNPNHLPAGTYLCKIVDATLKLTRSKDKVGLTIKYQISEGEYSANWPFTEWLWVPRSKPEDRTPEETRAFSRLKGHYKAYGFGADEMKKVSAKDLLGRMVLVTTKNRNENSSDEQIQIVNVQSPDDYEGSDEGLAEFMPSGVDAPI